MIRDDDAIRALVESRDGFESIARMAPEALGIDSADDFLVALTHRLAEIVPCVTDVALVERDLGSRLEWSRIVAGTGRFEADVGRPVVDLLDEAARDDLGRVLASHESLDSPMRRMIPLGPGDRAEAVLLFETNRPFRDHEARVLDVVAIAASAVLANLHVRRALHRAAHVDPSSGLPTRVAFERYLEAGIDATDTVAIVEFERLGDVTDTLGPKVADALLAVAARRLEEQLPSLSIVARIGASSLACLARGVELDVRALESAFGAPLRATDLELCMPVRVGVAGRGLATEAHVDLVAAAGLALSHGRRYGVATTRFEIAMALDARSRLARVAELRRGIDAGELELHFQPQLDLRTGEVVGAEALVRWRKPNGELVMPRQFIDVAEQSGLIVPIGEWVLREACHHARQWERVGLGGVRVAVNVSAAQFHRVDFVDVVSRTLFEFGLSPERLELELTESIDLADFAHARSIMERVAALGVRWALDDFGVGYSSLEYLRTLPVSRLKIDRAFTSAIASPTDGIAIPKMLVELAGLFGIAVTAEGIENETIAEILSDLGCTEAQGYHYAEPLPGHDFVAFARTRNSMPNVATGITRLSATQHSRSVA